MFGPPPFSGGRNVPTTGRIAPELFAPSGSGQQALAEVAVGRRSRPGGRRRSRRPAGSMYSSSGSPARRAWVSRNCCRRRWKQTKARPWSRWPSPSKPREKLSPRAEDAGSSSVSGVRGLARRMWASSGVIVAVGVGRVVGDVGLDLAVERGAGRLAPADQRLLLGEAGAVPELDEHPDDAHDVVAAADGPRRLAVAGADPHVALHARRRRWSRLAVPSMNPIRLRTPAPRPAPASARCAGCSRRASSAATSVAPGGPHQLAQGEQVEVLVVAADREQQVAVRAGRVEPVVGQERHLDELRAGAGRRARSGRRTGWRPTDTTTDRSAGGGGLPTVPVYSGGKAGSRSSYGSPAISRSISRGQRPRTSRAARRGRRR